MPMRDYHGQVTRALPVALVLDRELNEHAITKLVQEIAGLQDSFHTSIGPAATKLDEVRHQKAGG